MSCFDGNMVVSAGMAHIEGTNGFYCLIRKTLAKRGKRNCQSSEAKSFSRSGTRIINRPVAGRRSNPPGHRLLRWSSGRRAPNNVTSHLSTHWIIGLLLPSCLLGYGLRNPIIYTEKVDLAIALITFTVILHTVTKRS